MTDALDMDLVREFGRNQSEAAFAELVRRHLNLVYSVARRCTGNDSDAQDVTQAVFVILARKAAGLRDRTVVPGWLYETTRHTAACWQRTKLRRHAREQEAYMQSTLADTDTAEAWSRLVPHLEAGMSQLGERDRTLLALRFYENKSGSEAAALLGLREAAAHKRTARALEKLRKFFAGRGVVLSAAAIAGAVSANSVSAAPVTLMKTISVGAMAEASAAGTSTSSLVKATMKFMTYSELKLAASVTLAVLAAGVVASLALTQTTDDGKWTAQDIALRAEEVYAAASSYSDHGTVVCAGGGQNTETTFNLRLQRPNLYRIDWSQTGGLYAGKGMVWSDGHGDYFVHDSADNLPSARASKMHDMQFAFSGAGADSCGAASLIPGIFFSQAGGADSLLIAATDRTKLTRLDDEKIRGIDCQVVASVIDPASLPGGGHSGNKVAVMGTTTTKFWIGKRDHLIHQTQTTLGGFSAPLKFTDENLTVILERQHRPVTPDTLAALRTEMDKEMAQAQNGIFVFTQTHQNIVLDQQFSPADFGR